MEGLFQRVKEAVNYVKGKSDVTLRTGIVLGTGLGGLQEMVEVSDIIPYKDIPHFPVSTVDSHDGNLILGTLADVPVVIMQGRFHYYEGYSLEQVTFPIRVMAGLGIENLIITNAAGGMNAQYQKGDIAIITDHLNLTGQNPLVGVTDDRLGSRFPDMCQPYSEDLMSIARSVAADQGIVIKQGVYIWAVGPCLETKAEYWYMHNAGADIVGMSTVPEVIVAVQCGLKILGLSCITDLCIPESLHPVSLDEIIATAERTGPIMDHLIRGIVEKI